MNGFATVLSSPQIGRLGIGLIHSVWICTLIALVLGLFLTSYPGRTRIRHAAAWLALLLMAASIPAGAWPLTVSDGEASPRNVPDRKLESLAPTGGQNPEASSQEIAFHAEPSEALHAYVVADGQQFARPPALKDRASNLELVGLLRRIMAPFVAGIWMSRMTLLSAWRLAGWVTLKRLRNRGTGPVSGEIQQSLDRLLALFGIGRRVRVLESVHIDVPALIGWVRPVILLPAGILAGVSIREVELILAHELAHVRRADFLTNLIQTAIETVLFYHPAAWWVSAVIRHEREVCCDEIVVEVTGDRLLYARTLANLAALHSRTRSRPPRFASSASSHRTTPSMSVR